MLTAALLLGGCALQGPRAPEPGALARSERVAQLRAIEQFDCRGRIAVTVADNGFSAGLRWRQHAAEATLDLSGPLGVSAAQIRLSGDHWQVITHDGDTLDDAPAHAAVESLLGFSPPLGSLRYWVLGVSDPAMPAAEVTDAAARLSHLEQDGWQIDYGEYEAVAEQWLPRQLTARREDVRVRVVVNAWQLGP